VGSDAYVPLDASGDLGLTGFLQECTRDQVIYLDDILESGRVRARLDTLDNHPLGLGAIGSSTRGETREEVLREGLLHLHEAQETLAAISEVFRHWEQGPIKESGRVGKEDELGNMDLGLEE
jgi:hypothetical protein